MTSIFESVDPISERLFWKQASSHDSIEYPTHGVDTSASGAGAGADV